MYAGIPRGDLAEDLLCGQMVATRVEDAREHRDPRLGDPLPGSPQQSRRSVIEQRLGRGDAH